MSTETLAWCGLAIFCFSATVQLFRQVRREWYFPGKQGQNFVLALAVVAGIALGIISTLRVGMDLGFIAKF